MRPLSGKWLRGLLFASLAVNLFFVGLVSARVVLGVDLPGFESRERRGFHELPHPRTLREALPSERQELLETTLDAHREAVRAEFRSLNAARQRVADAIRAVPFDPAELEAAFDVLRQKNSDTAASLHRMLAELASRLDDEERAAVADTIRVWRPKEPRQDGESRE